MAYLNKFLLQMEGLAVLVLSIYFYFHLQFSWGIFPVLLLVPDISALGYLKNVKVGSILYNLFHTYTFPLILIICGFLIHNDSIFVGLALGAQSIIGFTVTIFSPLVFGLLLQTFSWGIAFTVIGIVTMASPICLLFLSKFK